MPEKEAQPSTVAWRVVCVKRVSVRLPRPHTHIAGLGTGESPTWADVRWTLRQVLKAIDEGDSFYILDEDSGSKTAVEKGKCRVCGANNLKPDSLEELRECKYKTDQLVPFSAS